MNCACETAPDSGEILKICDAHFKLMEASTASTIEMCAKVAETMKSGPVYFVEGRPNAGVVVGAIT